MKKPNFLSFSGLSSLALGIGLSLSFTPHPVMGADQLDPEADKILKSMSSYLAKTGAFSVNADIDFEAVTSNGQKLQFNSFAKLILQRPNKFYIERKGPLVDAQFIFDGKTLTLNGKRNNAYAQINAAGSIDDAIRAYELETGIPAPGADLLFADPYSILSTGIESSNYIGIAYVNGVKCHHLAFREDQVDWQIWIQVGEQPLPMKYVITSKLLNAAPQYQISFRDWVINPKIDDKQFTFAVPPGATKLNELPGSEIDESIERVER